MHKKQLTHLFLTFITCHVNLLTFQLLVIIGMFIELKKFVEFKEFIEFMKFKKNEKNVQLYFNVSKYLIDLF